MRGLAWFVAAAVAAPPSTSSAGSAPEARVGDTSERATRVGDAKIAVRKLQITGDVGPTWIDSFQSSLEAGLTARHAEVLALSGVGCDAGDDACWRAQARSLGATFVVRGEVIKDDRDYQLQLELVSPNDGVVLATTEQRCEPCGLAEVDELLRDVGGTLAARIETLATAESVVLFESTPTGAALVLDGVRIGTAPQQHGIRPGEHEAQATLDGHLSQQRRFSTVAGVDQTVHFGLPSLEREHGPHLRRLGWASLGVGVGALVVGGVMIGIDEQPVTSNCSGENVNAAGVCKFRRETLTGGIALVVAGAAAMIAGTVIAVLTTRRKPRSRKRVVVAPDGLRVRF